MFKAGLGKPSSERAYSFNCWHVMFRDQKTLHLCFLEEIIHTVKWGKWEPSHRLLLHTCCKAVHKPLLSTPSHANAHTPRLLPLLHVWNIASSFSSQELCTSVSFTYNFPPTGSLYHWSSLITRIFAQMSFPLVDLLPSHISLIYPLHSTY